MSVTGTPEVLVPKLTVVSEKECIIEGFKYVKLKVGKRGHFINLTEKSLDIKNYP
jgi:hypothetical protein